MIRFDCVTIFPEMFAAVTQSGITRRALEERRWVWQGWNPRDFATDAHRTVDDDSGNALFLRPGEHQFADDGVGQIALGVDDDYVARHRQRDRGVKQQIVSWAGLQSDRRA